ncbi:SNase-domain-containing protein [Aulographum hederae CBS 113979]|uniref:Probable endonuclease LCL3 n=1 Tax=Aulographum hederae CBS 113979 TaxID=1176131 RepID=A0A6G1GZK5_9PEZI|nr:SNase-domain-containing protein [Aulographum hederae CBS 113979]
MRWPWSDSERKDTSRKWTDNLNSIDWEHFLEPRNAFFTGVGVFGTLGTIYFHKRFIRRIPSSGYIKPGFYRQRSLFGKVTSVGDGDNFRLFHTPGGRLTGWGWLPGRSVPTKREDLSNRTIHVRIAGVDAPELAHFGRPAQPHSEEALAWLKSYILNRRVRAYIYRRDQYDRVVATVWVRHWLFRKDIGLEMLKRGLATVYEAKFGSEFGEYEAKYREAEKKAKKNKIGMWAEPSVIARFLGKGSPAYESPRDYKTRMQSSQKDLGTAEVKK